MARKMETRDNNGRNENKKSKRMKLFKTKMLA